MSHYADSALTDLPSESEAVEASVLFGWNDPAPGMLRRKAWTENLECERLDARTGSRRYPGVIRPPASRGGDVQSYTVVCAERLLRPGLRAPVDDALLSELEPMTTALAVTSGSLYPDLDDSIWLVEVFVANPQVATKVSFATKNALVKSGLAVSDRTPVLGLDDLEVILRMQPEEAYPTACVRWSATGNLGPDDALLAVMSLDPRETILHAGLCVAGRWTWLQ